MPVTVTRPRPSETGTAPAFARTVIAAGTSVVVIATRSSEAVAMSWSTETSARSRPLPITIRWSAVSSSSLIRWLETKTVRPSAASAAERLAHPADPFRVEPDGRLVEHQDGRIAEECRRDAEALAHSEREGARRAGRPRPRARRSAGPCRARRRSMPLVWAIQRRWFRADRPGCTAPASRSAPTRFSGRSISRTAGRGRAPRRPAARRGRAGAASSSSSRHRSGPTNPVTRPGRTVIDRSSTATVRP